MNDFKAYASRKLNESRALSLRRRYWARHGSTRYLWAVENVNAAFRYVVEEQGEPLLVFVDEMAIRAIRERR